MPLLSVLQSYVNQEVRLDCLFYITAAASRHARYVTGDDTEANYWAAQTNRIFLALQDIFVLKNSGEPVGNPLKTPHTNRDR